MPINAQFQQTPDWLKPQGLNGFQEGLKAGSDVIQLQQDIAQNALITKAREQQIQMTGLKMAQEFADRDLMIKAEAGTLELRKSIGELLQQGKVDDAASKYYGMMVTNPHLGNSKVNQTMLSMINFAKSNQLAKDRLEEDKRYHKGMIGSRIYASDKRAEMGGGTHEFAPTILQKYEDLRDRHKADGNTQGAADAQAMIERLKSGTSGQSAMTQAERNIFLSKDREIQAKMTAALSDKLRNIQAKADPRIAQSILDEVKNLTKDRDKNREEYRSRSKAISATPIASLSDEEFLEESTFEPSMGDLKEQTESNLPPSPVQSGIGTFEDFKNSPFNRNK